MSSSFRWGPLHSRRTHATGRFASTISLLSMRGVRSTLPPTSRRGHLVRTMPRARAVFTAISLRKCASHARPTTTVPASVRSAKRPLTCVSNVSNRPIAGRTAPVNRARTDVSTDASTTKTSVRSPGRFATTSTECAWSAVVTANAVATRANLGATPQWGDVSNVEVPPTVRAQPLPAIDATARASSA